MLTTRNCRKCSPFIISVNPLTNPKRQAIFFLFYRRQTSGDESFSNCSRSHQKYVAEPGRSPVTLTAEMASVTMTFCLQRDWSTGQPVPVFRGRSCGPAAITVICPWGRCSFVAFVTLCCYSLFSVEGLPQPEAKFLRTGKLEPPAHGAKVAHFSPWGAGKLCCDAQQSFRASLLRSDPLWFEVWGLRHRATAGSRLRRPPPRDPPPAAPVAAPGTSACSKHDLCLPPPTWHWHVAADL